jgi:ribosomal protein S12 methylthiotransferase accessory factor
VTGGEFEDAWQVLADPRILCFASALVLPSGAASEVMLQRALRLASRHGIAACIRTDLQGSSLTHPQPPRPAACLVLGARPNGSQALCERAAAWPLLRALPPSPPSISDRRHAFAAGPVRVGDQDIYGTGRAAEPRQAARKAQAEAWERLAWATLGEVAEGAWRDIADAIDPRTIVAYTPAQYAAPGFPFRAFSKRRRYAWRHGIDAETGASVALPAECVHALTALPTRFGAQAVTSTSTSGMAAWPDAEGALCRATLELIERDAFLRCWLGKRPPPAIRPSSLPAAARRRVAALEGAGFRVAVLELASEQAAAALAPVACIFVQNRRAPFTAVTAAAEFDAEQALGRALDEAEARVASALARPARPLATARAVEGPDEINRYYQTRRFYFNADFLGAGAAAERFGMHRPTCQSWPELKLALAARGLRLLAFDLTPPGAAVDQGRVPLRVMRAVVPGLLPIWFQPGLEPAGLASFPPGAGGRAPSIHPFT